jgi:hypothetical protein
MEYCTFSREICFGFGAIRIKRQQKEVQRLYVYGVDFHAEVFLFLFIFGRENLFAGLPQSANHYFVKTFLFCLEDVLWSQEDGKMEQGIRSIENDTFHEIVADDFQIPIKKSWNIKGISADGQGITVEKFLFILNFDRYI